MRQCPSCKNWTLDFDDYFGRFRCFNPQCSWMATSATERQIRVLRAYQQLQVLESTTIPELGLTITASYDEINDALLFDFNMGEPSFEYPEEDGRILWSVSRITGEVTGFTILGARKFGISQIRLDIETSKESIERSIRNLPNTLEVGRPTKVLIESISITMRPGVQEHSQKERRLTSACNKALDKFQQGYAKV
ncbi:MAG: hypothetical protein ACYC7E_15980 [Armatimonadota bacterium]